LCTREIQHTIKDSVHKLLQDQIGLLGLDHVFAVQDTVIRAKSGAEFIFAGLSTQTATSIKSMEGIDIVWCEEAQNITKRSWNILIPTIRKPGSEIWVGFNPELESDETYQRFVVNPPPDCISMELSYQDNEEFPEVLEAERLHCMRTNPDDYPNIWEGKCKPAVEGAIYFKQIQEAEKTGHVCRVAYDPMLQVQVVLDLGFGNFMAVSMVQKHLSELRIIDYFQVQGQNLSDITLELKKRPYNWGKVWLPHDGFSADAKIGVTSESLMRKLGWSVASRVEINELGREEGIRLVRMTFPQIYFDAEKCGAVVDNRASGGMIYGGLIECLKRYRRRLNQATGVYSEPVHDEYSDGADCLRYVCCNAPEFRNEVIVTKNEPAWKSKLKKLTSTSTSHMVQ
jgi:phage terminase large subunit